MTDPRLDCLHDWSNRGPDHMGCERCAAVRPRGPDDPTPMPIWRVLLTWALGVVLSWAVVIGLYRLVTS